MSVHSLKELLREESAPRSFAEDVRPAEETEIYQAFSFGRVGLRPQLMLCFIKCDGLHLALPYADLRSISTSDPSKGFQLEFSGREILIEGTNLDVCFRYLRDHRLSELTEASPATVLELPQDEPTVQKILIRKPKAAGH